MAVTLVPIAGMKIQVSAAAPANFNEAGFNALTWTDVGGFDTIPDLGDAYEDQSFNSISEGRIPYRGIRDGGGGEVSMADDTADAGQIIMKAAFDAAKGSAAERISYRVLDENNDYTAAQILCGAWRVVGGGANDIKRRSATIRVIPGSVVEGNDSP